MKHTIKKALIGGAAMLAMAGANAATISLTPATNFVSAGDSLTLEVHGTGFTDGATAGSVELTWDTAVLALTGAALGTDLLSDGTKAPSLPDPTATYEWDSLGGATVLPGSLDVDGFFTDSDIFGDPFPATGANFFFLSVTFDVIAIPDPSVVSVNIGSDGNWQNGLNQPITDVIYEGAEIAAIPLPAAAWLFGSGLLGLVGIARRRNTQAQS